MKCKVMDSRLRGDDDIKGAGSLASFSSIFGAERGKLARRTHWYVERVSDATSRKETKCRERYTQKPP